MAAAMELPLTEAELRALESVAENEGLGATTGELVAEWVREHLGQLPAVYAEDVAGASSSDDSRERLRSQYRPNDVEVLFVGESAPDGGTFFYSADSHLFHAVREACVRAYGDVPEGDAFLDWFRDRHFWLYDLADRPVNRMRGRPRRTAVEAGTIRLARLIRELGPDFVVAIKESIAPTVRQAAELARHPQQRVRVLPFPLYQWRRRFVDELAYFLGAEPRSGGQDRATVDVAAPTDAAGEGRLDLHNAIALVLEQSGRDRMSSREVANAIARLDLYRRRDGQYPPASQIAARVRRYPRLFDTDRTGVALRQTGHR
jgi:hypothetical protein